MKSVLFSICLIIPAILNAESVIRSAGQIDSVQLYRDRAVVVRKIPFNGKGKNTIILEGLPEGLYDETLTVRFSPDRKMSADKIRVKEIRVDKSFVESYSKKEAEVASNRLIEAKDRLESLTRNYNELMQEQQAILGVKPTRSAESNVSFLRLPYWKKLLGFVDSTLKKNLTQIDSLLHEIDTARTDLAIALAVAERYSSVKKRESRTVTIDLDPTTTSWTGDIYVEYAISGAYWFPSYRYRLPAQNDKKAILTFMALVSNETGEDWNHVKLTFSAADAGRRTKIPSLKEWKIARVYDDRRSIAVADAAPQESGGSSVARRKSAKPAKVVQSNEEISERNDVKLRPQYENLKKQQKLDQSITESRNLYIQNFDTIKEEQAQRKSRESQKKLDSLKTQLGSQESSYSKKDFKNARKSANEIIGILNELEPEQRDLFEPELNRAKQVIEWSYQYEKSKDMKSYLKRPSSAGTDTRYVAKFRETIPSDGAFVTAFINDFRFNVELSHEINAVARNSAYLAATSVYNDSSVLLPGPVSVYLEDDYAGQTQLPIIRRSEEFTVRTGIDPDIEVRSFENRFEKTEGVFVEMVAYTIEKTIQVKNNRKHSVRIKVLDRIPVSNNSEIDVTEINHSVKPDTDRNGIQVYEFTLEPGKVKEIKSSFTLKHSKKYRPVFTETNSPGI